MSGAWDEAVERAKAWLNLGRALEPKTSPPAEPPADTEPQKKEITNMTNPTNPPASHDEWQRALDAPWTQADLKYLQGLDPTLVRDAGQDAITGEKLLASPWSKRQVYDLLTRYPSMPLKGPPPPEDDSADRLLRLRYPTMFPRSK